MNEEQPETFIIVRDWQPGQSFKLVIIRPNQWRPGTPLPDSAFSIIVQPVEAANQPGLQFPVSNLKSAPEES